MQRVQRHVDALQVGEPRDHSENERISGHAVTRAECRSELLVAREFLPRHPVSHGHYALGPVVPILYEPLGDPVADRNNAIGAVRANGVKDTSSAPSQTNDWKRSPSVSMVYRRRRVRF